MNILAITTLGCMRRTFGPFLVICLLTLAALRSSATAVGTGQDLLGTLALWIHLPAFLVAAVAIAHLIEAWPLICRDQPGARHLRRLPIGPLHGCGKAAIASLLVLTMQLGLLGWLFDWQLRNAGLHRAAHVTHIASVPPGHRPSVLGKKLRSEQYRFVDGIDARSLELRPLASISGGSDYRPTYIRVLADGEALHASPLLCAGSNDLLEIEFEPRELHELEIRVIDAGDIRLQFPRGSILAISAASYPSVINCILTALIFLLPAGLSIATLILLRGTLSPPVALTSAMTILLLGTLGELTPCTQAVQEYSRGRWLLGTEIFTASLPSLSIIIGLLFAATLFPRRGMR